MAYTRSKRSQKAKNQARDRFGRWVSVGASVKWNTNGKDFAGVIDKIDGDEAKITVKNPDGTESQTSIMMSRLRVLASKATIPKDTATFHDKDNNFAKALENPEVYTSMEEQGAAAIERADGYKLTLEPRIPKDTGNPILYQLFGPGGISLGQYSESSKADFDAMVAEHKDKNAEEAPEAPEVVVAASLPKPYTVPAAVRTEIASALSAGHKLSPEDTEIASRLASDSPVSIEDIQWVHQYFSATEVDEKVRGGYRGKKWASKILEEPVVEKSYSFDDSILEYFATSSDENSLIAEKLFAVDREADIVYRWRGEFKALPDLSVDAFEAPTVITLGSSDAVEVARKIDNGAESVDVLSLDPVERNLFSLAESEWDVEELDRVTAILADATGYSPIERSVNSQRQHRGPGGKFGGQIVFEPTEAPAHQPEEVLSEPKSMLPHELPLVSDISGRITEWIESANEAPIMASGEEPVADDEDDVTGPTGEAVYFAIVDNVDQTAVLDAIAIVKMDGSPAAFVRTEGEWVNSPNSLLDFQGATPPPVVELDAPEPLKTVLTQVDTYDSEKGSEEEEPEALAATAFSLPNGSLNISDSSSLVEAVLATSTPSLHEKAHMRKRALALNRMDLIPEDWRTLSLAERGQLSSEETLFGEFGEVLPLMAGGAKGVADTPGDFKNVAKLKNYWAFGAGTRKWRPGTPGDLTRLHNHLVKYVGTNAWGLAQNIHKLRFGVPNITHDRATGQYRPRRRK